VSPLASPILFARQPDLGDSSGQARDRFAWRQVEPEAVVTVCAKICRGLESDLLLHKPSALRTEVLISLQMVGCGNALQCLSILASQ
jgi:hypothetical protein